VQPIPYALHLALRMDCLVWIKVRGTGSYFILYPVILLFLIFVIITLQFSAHSQAVDHRITGQQQVRDITLPQGRKNDEND
jgi:hypothetical protein